MTAAREIEVTRRRLASSRWPRSSSVAPRRRDGNGAVGVERFVRAAAACRRRRRCYRAVQRRAARGIGDAASHAARGHACRAPFRPQSPPAPAGGRARRSGVQKHVLVSQPPCGSATWREQTSGRLGVPFLAPHVLSDVTAPSIHAVITSWTGESRPIDEAAAVSRMTATSPNLSGSGPGRTRLPAPAPHRDLRLAITTAPARRRSRRRGHRPQQVRRRTERSRRGARGVAAEPPRATSPSPRPGARRAAAGDPALGLLERALHLAEGLRIAAPIGVGGESALTKCALQVVGRRARGDAERLPDRRRGGPRGVRRRRGRAAARSPVGAAAGGPLRADAPRRSTEEHARPGPGPVRLDLDQQHARGAARLRQRLFVAARAAGERVGFAKGLARGRRRSTRRPT